MDFLKIIKETEEEFASIAATLFNCFEIKTARTSYRLIEIEFYWTSPRHPDNTTYHRKHANPYSGEWFFHYSGVDIALRNDDIDGYGGILIRSIMKTETEKQPITKGPMVCAMKLFSGTNAFADAIQTRLLPRNFEVAFHQQSCRVGLSAQNNGSEKLRYRFVITPKN